MSAKRRKPKATQRPVETRQPRIAPSPVAPEAPFFAPEQDSWYVGVLAGIVSLLAFTHFFRHAQILLYGDATAHIHIARRVFDSLTPGPLQFGTVWLPLPHLLILPFILPLWAWQSGIGGSIPSMVAYVAGTLGVFRLVRGALPQDRAGRFAAWGAALIYAANPNLIYLQSTAMTESLSLAFFVWATVFFSEFVQATRATGAEAVLRRTRSLRRCGWMLMAAMLTRYDGWFAGMAFLVAALLVVVQWTGGRIALWRSPLRPVFVQFVLILAAVPIFWFSYNALIWGNPLEFANGPYSARAIEAKAARPGGWHYPGWHAPTVSATFFVKSAKLNVAGAELRPETQAPPSLWRLENLWVPLALLGAGLLLAMTRALWPLLLLWLPLPFYTLSIAFGSVPIFLPVWWPYSYYNVRYGMQLLPVLAVFPVLAAYFLARRVGKKGALAAATAVMLAFVSGSYFGVWQSGPVCLKEAQENSSGRVLFDQKLAEQLMRLPPGSTVLICAASHAAALEFAGFPLRRTVNETNEKQWPAALAAPGQSTDYVVAFETPDDPVWHAVQQHPDELQVLAILSSPNLPRAYLYRRH